MLSETLPLSLLDFSSFAAVHCLKFFWTLRRISSSIWSQNVVGCDSSRWCSCILSSTWTRAMQHTIDKSNPDTADKLTSVFLAFFWEICFSCFIFDLLKRISQLILKEETFVYFRLRFTHDEKVVVYRCTDVFCGANLLNAVRIILRARGFGICLKRRLNITRKNSINWLKPVRST